LIVAVAAELAFAGAFADPQAVATRIDKAAARTAATNTFFILPSSDP
jgi:hypothetical protein